MKIIIGTRGSELSLTQTQIIKRLLLKQNPHLFVEIKIISTKGDKDLSPIPLDSVGKGWFTKELDSALIENEIDIAVHSLKDIPETLDKNLFIAAISKREDPRDVLVSKKNIPLNKVKKGAVIGTDSMRRKSQLLHIRPDLKVISVRGNINTRLKKLFDGDAFDGLILAAAGLKRLGMTKIISQYFPASKFIPSPGQGALAVVVNKKNKNARSLVKNLNHYKTVKEVEAERAFSLEIEGGCKTPTGAYSYIKGGKINMIGYVGTEEGKFVEQEKITGKISEGKTLGIKLARDLLKRSKKWQITNTDYNLINKQIVITRAKSDSKEFKKKLQSLGAKVHESPSIKIIDNTQSVKVKKIINNLTNYDYLIFTSPKSIEFLVKALKKAKIDKNVLQNKKIAAVGPVTATLAKKYGLKVDLIPAKYTTSQLAKEIKITKGLKILMPRADIAEKDILKYLRNAKAEVTDVAIYKTQFIVKKDKKLENMLNNDKIDFITFTSPSTVIGTLKKMGRNISGKLLSIPAVSIGPVTTATAAKLGFKCIYTSDVFTTDGMLKKLLEISNKQL